MIPDEAVEAAMSALGQAYGEDAHCRKHEYVVTTLEAAAPRIRAQALLDAAETLGAAPPMLHAKYVNTLRLYAAEPWRLSTCPSECAAGHPGREHGAAL